MKKNPKIMYDQTQFTPLYFFDKNGIWINDKSYFLTKNISGYAPDKWYLYTQCKPSAFWFGAYDEEALRKEAEFGLKNFSNQEFFKKFEREARNIFKATKKIANKYLKNFHHKELEYVINRKEEVMVLLNDIRDICALANGYYFLTQPQRLTIIEEKLNQSKKNNELKFIAGAGRRNTRMAEIDKDILFYADNIRKAKCFIAQYNKKNKTIFEEIKQKINNLGFLGWGFYGGEIINQEYLLKKIISSLEKPQKLQNEVARIISVEGELERRKHIIEKNKNNAEYRLADVVGHLSVLRFDMNTYILCLLNYVKIIVSKLSEYYQIPKEDMDTYEFEEILKLIKSGDLVDKKVIKERKIGYLRIFRHKVTKTLVGKNALLEIKHLLEHRKKEISNTHLTKGVVAFLPRNKGKINGRAFVLSSAYNADEQLKNFKNGDILIAIQTHPSLVPIMKKASAIITDEGGLTCHAAIVSREFKIPCIVGTRLATKFLKSGDLVEINFKNAIVRKK